MAADDTSETEDTWERRILIPSHTLVDQEPHTMRVFGDTDVSLHTFFWKVSSGQQAFTFYLFEDRTDTDLSCSCSIDIRAGERTLCAVEMEAILPFTHRCYTEYNFLDLLDYHLDDDQTDLWTEIRLKFSRDKPAPSSRMYMGQFAAPMLADPIFSDVVVVCGDKTFDCHKLILAGRSEVFKTMLTSQFKEAKENMMEISHFEPDTVQHILEFIYRDEVDEKAATWELFEASKMYDLALLQKQCLSGLRKSLDVNNCCEMLEAATLYDLPDLFDLFVSFLRNHKTAVMQTDGWKRVAANARLMATIEQWIS